MDIRHGNTSRELLASGAWVKLAPKHYQHIDGAEVKYNRNAWGWQIVGQLELWKSLWVAAHWATRCICGCGSAQQHQEFNHAE